MAACRVLIVDDDPFILTSLGSALEYHRLQVVGRAATSREALEVQQAALAEHAPLDVALVDLDLGVGPNGLDLAWALRQAQPNLGIVMLTTYSDPRLLAPDLRTPPPGTRYVRKTELKEIAHLVEQITSAARSPMQRGTAKGEASVNLTSAQLEVLRMVANGMSSQAIAHERGVSVNAIEQMIARLCVLLDIPRGSADNPRVHLARAYLAMSGLMLDGDGNEA